MKPAEFDPEEPVVEAVREGDRFAFAELVRRHQKWVRGVIFGVLGDPDRTDDVSQQTWLVFWQRIGELRDVKRWRPWLYRLARNAALDAGRQVSRQRRNSQQWKQETTLVPGPESADVSLGRNERHAEVLNAIRSLPALYREPFVLKHVDGWSYRQIAEVMDMPIDSVETRLVRARRLLRECLKEKLD
ncbi:MAG: RNA polymerase sigma factor [Planctomycetes bacterium]|nr:RNA polymerase sigma factor [Planctomycetota bacterium]